MPQTGWDLPNPVSVTFDQATILIIKHRLKNPAITLRHNLATDVVSVGNELEQFTKARLGMPLDNALPPPIPGAAPLGRCCGG